LLQSFGKQPGEVISTFVGIFREIIAFEINRKSEIIDNRM